MKRDLLQCNKGIQAEMQRLKTEMTSSYFNHNNTESKAPLPPQTTYFQAQRGGKKTSSIKKGGNGYLMESANNPKLGSLSLLGKAPKLSMWRSCWSFQLLPHYRLNHLVMII